VFEPRQPVVLAAGSPFLLSLGTVSASENESGGPALSSGVEMNRPSQLPIFGYVWTSVSYSLHPRQKMRPPFAHDHGLCRCLLPRMCFSSLSAGRGHDVSFVHDRGCDSVWIYAFSRVQDDLCLFSNDYRHRCRHSAAVSCSPSHLHDGARSSHGPTCVTPSRPHGSSAACLAPRPPLSPSISHYGYLHRVPSSSEIWCSALAQIPWRALVGMQRDLGQRTGWSFCERRQQGGRRVLRR
jgi:hypothetical protein